MVAGGGGSNDGTDYGGNAGGLIGYSSSRDRWTNTGGSQVSGGVYQRGDACGMGSFGVGSTCGATGGGGYYGGAGANHSDGSGSGGSSFISGHLGSVAVNSATDTSPRKDSSDNVCTAESAKTDITCSYHYSGMKFTNTKMIDGSGYVWTNDVTTEQTGMPTTNDPDKTEMGHRGNGYAKISDLSGKKIVRIVDNYNDYDNEIEYNDGDKLAGLPSKTLDGYEFVGWFLDKGFTKKVTSDTIIHANTYLYAYYRPIGDYCDSLVNQKIDFDYTGGIEKYVIRCKGTYELETWGAQGGYAGSVSLQGGYGGYSRGYVDFDLGEVLYIAVGQEGTPNSKLTSSPIFNGGGLGNNNDANTYAGAGGGATHIALVNGELFRLENSKNDILIVAGGGGGASNHGNNSKSNGGSAGGLVGNDGSSMAWCGGKAGTQTESGASCESGQGVGSFGQGGVGIPNAGGGGGAGWYGGSGGKGGSGGGGSSYVGNTRLKNTFMAGYNTEGSGYRSVTAYLENKDGFLEVNGDVYNSFDSALAALVGKEGTIKVVSDSTITRDSIIPADYNVTLDLNGHVLTLNNPIVNNGRYYRFNYRYFVSIYC